MWSHVTLFLFRVSDALPILLALPVSHALHIARRLNSRLRNVTMSLSAEGLSCRSYCPEPIDVNKRGQESTLLLTAQQELDPELGKHLSE